MVSLQLTHVHFTWKSTIRLKHLNVEGAWDLDLYVRVYSFNRMLERKYAQLILVGANKLTRQTYG